MKHLHKITFFILSILIIISCTSQKKDNIQIANHENQWPMAGGPEGNWKIKTNDKIPLQWSVRNHQNIKWKKKLPEGGQSGIAVWNDKLFLTINPPVKKLPQEHIALQYVNTKKKFQKKLAEIHTKFTHQKNSKYITIHHEFILKKNAFEKYLNSIKKYTQGNKEDKEKAYKATLNKHQSGKDYQKATSKFYATIAKLSPEFKTLHAKYNKIEKENKGGATSKNIILLCLDANNGDILWKKTVKGTVESEYNYGFSDATTPCPITDGKNVWAINASGGMACFTIDGELIWERTWTPVTKGPFNKQYNSIIYKNFILNVEPPTKTDTLRVKGWHYVHAFDKYTGERLWVSDDALTHYNAPIIGKTKEGKMALLIGRGGPHGVPERPVGLSLIDLENRGENIWSWEPKEGNKLSGWGAVNVQLWDKDKATWFFKKHELLVIDSNTGKLISKKKLNTIHDKHDFSLQNNDYKISHDIKIGTKRIGTQRHCNIFEGDHHYYMIRYQPYLARHNFKTGKNEYLEVPREFNEDGSYIWKIPQKNDGLNSQGQMNSSDARTRGDGFQKCFLGTPTMINNYIFFTNAIGLVYVIDANAKKFDKNALIAVNDLGKKGETWTVNSLSFANGHIYHRTIKEIICIGK